MAESKDENSEQLILYVLQLAPPVITPTGEVKIVKVQTAEAEHAVHADAISQLIEEAAKSPDAALAKRTPEYVADKMRQGKAIIALSERKDLAGFCYLETWEHNRYVANSGLIVAPLFRQQGLAKKIKEQAFALTCQKYPDAKLFGLTTNSAVVKINTELGYKPVPFSALTTDDEFWAGCKTCKFFDVLSRTSRSNCLCTGMLVDLGKKNKK